ncbi:MAG TPA: 3D domain-containing protein [Candidatus Binatia bacterium]|nr:3D domain-containing protein [Candidatus Binatia bacterium]
MNADWGSAVVVDPRTLSALDEDNRRLRVRTRRLAWGFGIAMGMVLLSAGRLYSAAGRLDDVEHGLKECRRSATRSSGALAALAHSHEQVLAATEQAPSVGTRSWGRRFTVTKYTPMSPAYGRFNHGITATLTKADPQARIIAVDPKLIPYGSWVWVESLGWFHAEDCGSAIKGFRLDVLATNEQEAMEFGKQDRFAIVVPPEA